MRSAVRAYSCLLITLILCCRLIAWSSGSTGIDVRPAGSSRFVVAPGKILTLGVRVSNASDSARGVQAELRLPEHWRPVLFEPAYVVGSHASEVKMISILAPASTPAGAYAVRYVAKGGPVPPREVMLVVAVGEVRQLSLQLTDVPRYTIFGEPSRATALVTNRGNKARTVRLFSGAHAYTMPDSSHVHLAPGETRSVGLALLPPADTGSTGRALSVVAEIEADSVSRVQATGWVRVIPRSESEEQYIHMPLAVRLRAAGQDGATGLQLEVTGASSLTSSADNLDFKLRTPDIQRQSLLGYHDEYRALYRNGPYRLFFGDRAYGLSTLTEYGRYAFGLGGEADIDDATVGAFVNRNRFYPLRQEEQAVYARYRLPSSTIVGLNYLQSVERERGRAVTFQATSQPHRFAALDVEYGMGALGDEPDNAVSLRLSGRDSLGSYELRYLRGGTHYPGYYRDMDFVSGSFMLFPFEALRVEGYLRDEHRNLEKDPSLFYAPHNRLFQLGAAYGEYLAIHYRGSRQNDALPESRYNRAEDLMMLRSGISFSRMNIFGSAEIGTVRDLLLRASGPYRRYALFTGFRPFDGHTYGLSVEYTMDRNLYVNEDQRRIAAGLTAGVFLGRHTFLNVSLYGNRTTALPAQTYSTVDAMIEQRLPWGHQLIIRGRQSMYTPSADGRDRAFLIEYAMPIGIPIRRTETTGAVSGRVVDAQTGRGLAGVLLYLGNAVTSSDGDGRFSFPVVTPDTVTLIADLTPRGIDLVTEEPTPLVCIVNGGDETEVILNVTRSATVTGTVTLYDFDDPMRPDTTKTVMISRGAYPGLIVELTRDGEVHRRISDSRGRFSCTGLRPGRWTLRMIDENLPEYHYIHPAVDTINVGPGTTSDMNISILPRRRRIHIIHDETGTTGPGAQPATPLTLTPAPSTRALTPQAPTRSPEKGRKRNKPS